MRRGLPWVLPALAAPAYAAAAIFRHERYGSNAYDLGIFDQTVWGWSRLAPALDNTVRGTPTVFIDHFQPILALLAPVYWVWPDARALLVVQAVALAVAAVPLGLWVRETLGPTAALGLQAAYLGFWGVLAGNLFDFHDAALAAPLLAVALYGLVTRRWTTLAVASALALLVREDVSLTIAALGVVTALRGARRLGLALAAVSIAWFAVTVNLVVPALSGGAYEHWSYYGATGAEPRLGDVVRDPLDTIARLWTPTDKLVQLANLFAPWLLAPLGSVLTLVAVPNLLERFLSAKPAHWQQGFHYSLALAPILAFATADALRRLPRRALLPVLAAMLAVGAFFTAYRMRPLAELARLPSAERAAAIDECLRTIPDDASVLATSALVPHLSQRERIFVLRRAQVIPRVDVVALDTSAATGEVPTDAVRDAEDALRADGYVVVCRRGPTVVLRR